jgi:hypothetical protein
MTSVATETIENEELDSILTTNEHLTDYMTCAICFQFVTDNRECFKCHRLCCLSCLLQFHSRSDKRLRKPCPACNTPTLDEYGQEITSILASSDGIDAMENELELIEANFLLNISGSLGNRTTLTHNKLLQRMVNDLPTNCQYCKEGPILHGDLPRHYFNCQARAIPYNQYYELNCQLDQSRQESLRLETESNQLRQDNSIFQHRIAELERQLYELSSEYEEKDLLLQATHERMRQLIYTNHQFQITIERLGNHNSIN